MSSTPANLRPIDGASRRSDEPLSRVVPPERNTPATDTLRRHLQDELKMGHEPRLAAEARVSCHSVAHQVEGSSRLSADALRAALLLLDPDVTSVYLTDWLAGTGLVVSAMPVSERTAALIPAAARACADTGRVAEGVVLAAADGRISRADELPAIEADCDRGISQLLAVKAEAKRLAR